MVSLWFFIMSWIVSVVSVFLPPLKGDDKLPYRKKLNTSAFILLPLSLIILIMGIKDSAEKSESERKNSDTNIQLKDTLSLFRTENMIYGGLLKSMGVNITELKSLSSKQTDSLIDLLKSKPSRGIDSGTANFGVCANPGNVKASFDPTDGFINLEVLFCNNSSKLIVKDIFASCVAYYANPGSSTQPKKQDFETPVPFAPGQSFGRKYIIKGSMPTDTIFMHVYGTYKDQFNRLNRFEMTLGSEPGAYTFNPLDKQMSEKVKTFIRRFMKI